MLPAGHRTASMSRFREVPSMAGVHPVPARVVEQRQAEVGDHGCLGAVDAGEHFAAVEPSGEAEPVGVGASGGV